MRTWLTALALGLLAAGCASNASTPGREGHQALAPTGKLRVALYTGAPASIVVGVDEVAIALPKGRESGLAYVRKYAEDVRAEGLVRAAIQRAGLRGAADK